MQKIGHHTAISVQASPIHGWGVFADVDIPSESFIETAPGILIPQEIISACYAIMSMDGIPPESLVLDQYGIGWPGKKVCIPLGWIGLYNHSDDPNAEFYMVEGQNVLSVRSVKEISAGSEILVNYGPYWWAAKNYLKKI